MSDLLTQSNVMFVLGLLAIMFSVYHYFKNPQEELETKQALTDKDLSNKATLLAQKEVENKAVIIAQQLQWTIEYNDKRFLEIQTNIKEAFSLAQNHSNEALAGIKELTVVVNSMGNSITRLSTIIDERIPKK